MEHSKGHERFGENIAKWFTLGGEELPLVQAWYSEMGKYKGGDFSIDTCTVQIDYLIDKPLTFPYYT